MWRLAIALALLIGAAADASAENYFKYEMVKFPWVGNTWYEPIIRMNMEPYGYDQVFIQQPGDTLYKEVFWNPAEQTWRWTGQHASAPNFEGLWRLMLLSSAGEQWDFSFQAQPVTESEFLPLLSITAPAAQYQTVSPGYTFRWDVNGADVLADHLWVKIVGESSAIKEGNLPLSTTEWTPSTMPLV